LIVPGSKDNAVGSKKNDQVEAIDPFDFAQGRLSIAMVPHLRE